MKKVNTIQKQISYRFSKGEMESTSSTLKRSTDTDALSTPKKLKTSSESASTPSKKDTKKDLFIQELNLKGIVTKRILSR